MGISKNKIIQNIISESNKSVWSLSVVGVGYLRGDVFIGEEWYRSEPDITFSTVKKKKSIMLEWINAENI